MEGQGGRWGGNGGAPCWPHERDEPKGSWDPLGPPGWTSNPLDGEWASNPRDREGASNTVDRKGASNSLDSEWGSKLLNREGLWNRLDREGDSKPLEREGGLNSVHREGASRPLLYREGASNSMDREGASRSLDRDWTSKPLDRDWTSRTLDREGVSKLLLDREETLNSEERECTSRPLNREWTSKPLLDREGASKSEDRECTLRPLDREGASRPLDREGALRALVRELASKPLDREWALRALVRELASNPLDREWALRALVRDWTSNSVDREGISNPLDREGASIPLSTQSGKGRAIPNSRRELSPPSSHTTHRERSSSSSGRDPLGHGGSLEVSRGRWDSPERVSRKRSWESLAKEEDPSETWTFPWETENPSPPSSGSAEWGDSERLRRPEEPGGSSSWQHQIRWGDPEDRSDPITVGGSREWQRGRVFQSFARGDWGSRGRGIQDPTREQKAWGGPAWKVGAADFGSFRAHSPFYLTEHQRKCHIPGLEGEEEDDPGSASIPNPFDVKKWKSSCHIPGLEGGEDEDPQNTDVQSPLSVKKSKSWCYIPGLEGGEDEAPQSADVPNLFSVKRRKSWCYIPGLEGGEDEDTQSADVESPLGVKKWKMSLDVRGPEERVDQDPGTASVQGPLVEKKRKIRSDIQGPEGREAQDPETASVQSPLGVKRRKIRWDVRGPEGTVDQDPGSIRILTHIDLKTPQSRENFPGGEKDEGWARDEGLEMISSSKEYQDVQDTPTGALEERIRQACQKVKEYLDGGVGGPTDHPKSLMLQHCLRVLGVTNPSSIDTTGQNSSGPLLAGDKANLLKDVVKTFPEVTPKKQPKMSVTKYVSRPNLIAVPLQPHAHSEGASAQQDKQSSESEREDGSYCPPVKRERTSSLTQFPPSQPVTKNNVFMPSSFCEPSAGNSDSEPEEKSTGFRLKPPTLIHGQAPSAAQQASGTQLVIQDVAGLELWHRRFAHADPKAILELENRNLTTGIKVDPWDAESIAKCKTCLRVKGRVASFPLTPVKSSTQVVDLIHCQLCEPFNVLSQDQFKYALIFVDDFSRFCATYLLRKLGDTGVVLNRYMAMKNKRKEKPKAFQINSADEVFSELMVSLLEKAGLPHKRDVEHTPGQSRTAERELRSLLEMTQCMLGDAKLPNSFWSYAISTATFLWNRLPGDGGTETPFHLWHGATPQVGHLRVFGSLAYHKLNPNNQLPLLLIGYLPNRAVYILKSLDTGRCIIRNAASFSVEHTWVEESGAFVDAFPGQGNDTLVLLDIAAPTTSQPEMDGKQLSGNGAQIESSACGEGDGGEEVGTGEPEKTSRIPAQQASGPQLVIQDFDGLELWHRRFAHADPKAILELKNRNLATGIKVDPWDAESVAKCETCLRVKGRVASFPLTTVKSSVQVVDLIHCQLCEPFNIMSQDQFKYALIFVDDFSRFCVTYLLKKLEDTGVVLKWYMAMKNKRNKRPKVFQINSADEDFLLLMLSLLQKAGLQHKWNLKRTPGQSRTAERELRSLLEMTQCMLGDAKLPNSFWSYAISTATFLWNRLPGDGGTETPFHLWHGEPPHVGHLRVFGSLAYHKLNPNNKLPLLLIGYIQNHASYKLMSLDTGRYTGIDAAPFSVEHTWVEERGAFVDAFPGQGHKTGVLLLTAASTASQPEMDGKQLGGNGARIESSTSGEGDGGEEVGTGEPEKASRIPSKHPDPPTGWVPHEEGGVSVIEVRLNQSLALEHSVQVLRANDPLHDQYMNVGEVQVCQSKCFPKPTSVNSSQLETRL